MIKKKNWDDTCTFSSEWNHNPFAEGGNELWLKVLFDKSFLHVAWNLISFSINYMNCFQAILKQNCTFCSSLVNYLISWFLSFFLLGEKRGKKEKKHLCLAFDHILRSSSVGAVCSGVAMAQLPSLYFKSFFALSCLREEDIVTPLKASE